jgi:O-antigen/teichoic acid export membrane protein
LTPSDYGILATVNIVGSILTIVSLLGFEAAFARYFYDFRGDTDGLRQYLGSLLSFVLVVNLVFLGSLTLFGQGVSGYFFPTGGVDYHRFLVLQIGIVYFGLSSNFVLTSYQVREQPLRYVAFSVLSFVVSTGLIIYYVAFRAMGAYGSLLGALIGSVLMFAISIAILWPDFAFSLAWRPIKEAAAFGAPVSLHLLFGWLMGYADRVVLIRYVSLQDLGLYYFAIQVAMVMYFVVESVNQAWTPFFFDVMKNRPDATGLLSRIINLYYLGLMVLALIGILFGIEVLSLITSQRYHLSFKYIPYLILNGAILGIYFMNINTLFFFKKTSMIPVITLAAAIVKIVFSLILVPVYSVGGAIVSSIAASLFWSGAVYLAANNLYRIRYNFRRLGAAFCLFLITMLSAQVISFSSVFANILFRICLLLVFVVWVVRVCGMDHVRWSDLISLIRVG